MSNQNPVETSNQNKRVAILNATLALITERGFHNTPMSVIAKTSGVSAGIIYHYFSGKEQLINILYAEIKLEIIRAMLEGYSTGLSFKDRFDGIWFNYSRYILSNPSKGLFLEQFENSPLIKHVIKDDFTEAIAPFFEFLEQGVEEGVFKALPPLVLFDLGFSPVASLVKRHIAGIIVFDDELMREAADACWNAIEK